MEIISESFSVFVSVSVVSCVLVVLCSSFTFCVSRIRFVGSLAVVCLFFVLLVLRAFCVVLLFLCSCACVCMFRQMSRRFVSFGFSGHAHVCRAN